MSQGTNRTLSRRKFLMLMATAAGSSAVAACVATPVPPPPAAPEAKATEPPKPAAAATKPPEPTAAPAAAAQITIKCLWSPGAMDTYIRDGIEAYSKKKPNVKFEPNVIEQEQKRATEVTIMSNPGAPDFAWINFGSGLTDRFAKAKVIVPLNKYYEQYGWWKFLPKHLHTHEYEGQMYHFSLTSTLTPIMWCSKKLMAKVGWAKPPETMDELYAWADACRKNELEPLAFGDRDGWPGFHMYQCIATRTVPLKDYEKILYFDKKEAFMKDHPGFEEAFQIMRDLELKKVWSRGSLDMNDTQSRELLLTGKAVAYESVSGRAAILRKAMGDDVDFFMFPQIKKEISVPLTASYPGEFLVSSFSKVQDEVAAFFDFMYSKEGQRLVSKSGELPIRTDLTDADMAGVGDPIHTRISQMYGSGKYPITDEIVTFWPAELYALLRASGQAAVSGQKTPKQIIGEMDDLAAKFRAGKA